MNESAVALRRKVDSAGELRSVVRTMKALAAGNLGQYERSTAAIATYRRMVELGLGACFRTGPDAATPATARRPQPRTALGAVVFGSDQGLVGQFNEVAADHAIEALRAAPGRHQVWVVGERVHARLADAGLTLGPPLPVPSSVQAVAPLVGTLLVQWEAYREAHGGSNAADGDQLRLIYNRPEDGAAYGPVCEELLPLDQAWFARLRAAPWSTPLPPQVVGADATLRAHVREFVFVSVFGACAASLASENASRLAAMQRADKNIEELLAQLQDDSHQLRQSGIDEELFDLVSGFEALAASHGSGG